MSSNPCCWEGLVRDAEFLLGSDPGKKHLPPASQQKPTQSVCLDVRDIDEAHLLPIQETNRVNIGITEDDLIMIIKITMS